MDTVNYATETFLRDELAKATLRITQLEESHARLAQRDMNTAAALNRLKEDLKDWTRSELNEENISLTMTRLTTNFIGGYEKTCRMSLN